MTKGKLLRPSLNKEFCAEFIRLYTKEDKPIREVCHRMKTTLDCGYRILRKYNIPTRRKEPYKRKYEIDENFFEKINTKEKAYFLGLMYADGYSGKNHRGSCASHISLTSDDAYLLEKFSSLVYKIYKPLYEHLAYSETRPNGKTIQVRAAKTFYVYNPKFYSDLQKQGCIQNKTKLLKFPTTKQVPKKLLNHFIRGYFDGDGCIRKYCNSKGYCSKVVFICGTKEFSEGLLKALKEYHIESKIVKNGNITALTFGKRIYVENFYRFLYKNGTVFLKRKKDKFES